jgi:NADPH:quinone reductase-like Zn-dependent oxidoreductase
MSFAVRQALRVSMSRTGLLDDLQLQAVPRRSPGPDDVEIEVCAIGLNFRELLKALDVYPGQEVQRIIEDHDCMTFDGDCAGRIVAVGSNVAELQIGDEVIAMGSDIFCSFAIVPACLVLRKPSHLSFEDAATIPLAFCTVWYAFHKLARIRAAERVLIHAAAGGVGLAAIQVCRLAGAEILATAGSEAKREFLGDLGIEQVMDSRSFDFVDETLRGTAGKGVDIVLNSLAGDFMAKSLSLLAPFGRFLEIGKRDIYDDASLRLYPFRNNLSFFAIDLVQLPPLTLRSLLAEVLRHFESRDLKPLPYRAFPISEVASAFRYMRRANHIGKIVITIDTDHPSTFEI